MSEEDQVPEDSEPVEDLARFVQSEHVLIEKFEAFWQKRRKENPSVYLEHMTEVEWLEQFNSWANRVVE